MIEVKNITKKYGSFVAVDNVSFEVKDNEIVGFLGPNGAGKSTTMNMLTGFIEPTDGKIIINGFDISKSPIKAKKQIGYMPESVPLYYDLTVKEFINYMADLRRLKKNKKEEVDKIMEQTGLKNVQNKLIKNISRGYKQRVSLAGTLIGNPQVLILDEPTVGLDPKQITEIRSLIKELGKNHTVILSSHLLSEVSQICERVIIINNGKIVAVDTPENLEKKTKDENSLLVTVEDNESKMKDIQKKLHGVKDIKLIKDNDDGTAQYMIVSEKNIDIRKEIFNVFPQENITIFELKKSENTLEDAFLQIINAKNEEIKAIEEKKAKQEAKRKEELSKMDKKDRKNAIKEDKKKIKQEKDKELEEQWERERAQSLAEKHEKEKLKETKKRIKEQKRNINKKKNDDTDASKNTDKNTKNHKQTPNNTEKPEGTPKTNVVNNNDTNTDKKTKETTSSPKDTSNKSDSPKEKSYKNDKNGNKDTKSKENNKIENRDSESKVNNNKENKDTKSKENNKIENKEKNNIGNKEINNNTNNKAIKNDTSKNIDKTKNIKTEENTNNTKPKNQNYKKSKKANRGNRKGGKK